MSCFTNWSPPCVSSPLPSPPHTLEATPQSEWLPEKRHHSGTFCLQGKLQAQAPGGGAAARRAPGAGPRLAAEPCAPSETEPRGPRCGSARVSDRLRAAAACSCRFRAGCAARRRRASGRARIGRPSPAGLAAVYTLVHGISLARRARVKRYQNARRRHTKNPQHPTRQRKMRRAAQTAAMHVCGQGRGAGSRSPTPDGAGLPRSRRRPGAARWRVQRGGQMCWCPVPRSPRPHPPGRQRPASCAREARAGPRPAWCSDAAVVGGARRDAARKMSRPAPPLSAWKRVKAPSVQGPAHPEEQ